MLMADGWHFVACVYLIAIHTPTVAQLFNKLTGFIQRLNFNSKHNLSPILLNDFYRWPKAFV